MADAESDQDSSRSDEAPPDVSNQNREEPSAPHGGAHGKPDSGQDTETSDSERSSPSRGDGGTRGGAGESSQATGNPRNAG